MSNLDSTLKSRDISFLTQVHLFKAMFSPVVMYGCKSWTMKKAKWRRIDAFCGAGEDPGESLGLSIDWSNQSIDLIKPDQLTHWLIKPVNPKGNQSWRVIGRTDAEAKTPVLWPPDVKNWSLEKTLMLGKFELMKRRGKQKMGWLDGITYLMDMGLNKLQESAIDREAWHVAVHEVANCHTRLSNQTELIRSLALNY